MPKQQTQSSTAHYHDHCPCCELADAVGRVLQISPKVKEHLNNSRVEFLKAVREVIDSRIEHLLSQPQKGTRVAVE